MKNILFIGIIPGTWMLCLTVFGISIVLNNTDFSIDFFIAIITMLLGICGYVGLLTLFKGLHKTNHLKKLILFFLGLIGSLIFMLRISPRNIIDWIFEYNLESLIVKSPIIVTIVFLILSAIGYAKIKMLIKNN